MYIPPATGRASTTSRGGGSTLGATRSSGEPTRPVQRDTPVHLGGDPPEGGIGEGEENEEDDNNLAADDDGQWSWWTWTTIVLAVVVFVALLLNA